MRDWETLGAVDPRELTDARLQLHWAAQAAAAVGKQLLPHRPDYGEQSFQWSRRHRVLAQGLVTGVDRPFRSALRQSSPALLILGEDGEMLREMPLAGRTLEELYVWLQDEIEMLLGHPLENPLERPGELPPHPVGTGAAFTASDSPAYAEIGRYFGNLDRLLRRIEDRNPGASPVRCWPHHFDIATLITVAPGKSIGVGLEPGDVYYDEPYFYANLSPRPAKPPVVDLPAGGSWHSHEWIGAVLPVSRLRGANLRDDILAFIRTAVAANQAALG